MTNYITYIGHELTVSIHYLVGITCAQAKLRDPTYGRVPYASLHKRRTKGQFPLTLRDYEDPRMWAPLRNAPFTTEMVASREQIISNIPSIYRSTEWCHVQSAASRGAFLVHGLVV